MKILRKLFGCISLTAAMFVFQACYGLDPDYYWDPAKLTFRVVSDDGMPLPDIKVMSQKQSNSESYSFDWKFLGYTDSAGVITRSVDTNGLDIKFRFSDKFSVYTVKDTILDNYNVDTVEIVLSRVHGA